MIGIPPRGLRTIAALEYLEKAEPGTGIEDLSRKIGWSRVQLYRKCREMSGLSPQFIQRVFRIQRMIKNFDRRYDLTDQALFHGYYDQSHMIRDFKRLTTLCPSDFFPEACNIRTIL